MGQRLPLAEDIPFLLQIKTLGDDELLDFWAETQQLETLMREELQPGLAFTPDYERLILLELQLRSCQRGSRAQG